MDPLAACHRPYPGGTRGLRSFVPPRTAAFPFRAEGRLPQQAFSGPARRSLALWPAGALSYRSSPLTSKALVVSLPPQPLRLLPAGTTSCRRGSRTHGTYHTFHGAHPKRQRGAPSPSLALRVGVNSPRRAYKQLLSETL